MGLLDSVKAKVPAGVDLGGIAFQKLNEVLDEYKKAVTVLQSFGFSIGSFKVGTGLAGVIPEVSTTLTASVAALQQDALKKLIAEHPDQPLLASMLNTLVQAKGFYDRVGLSCGSASLHLTLSIPPSVMAEFH